MAYTSSFFVGSITLGASTFRVNGVDVVLPAGTWYLTDPTAARSLVTAFATIVATQAAGATAILTPSGRVRVAAAGVFSVTWNTATALKDALGFTGNLAAADAYAAPTPSPLFWSPGKPAMFMNTPLGVEGMKRHVVNQSTAGYTGQTQSTSFGYRTFQRFMFQNVNFERLMTVDELPGEYDVWFTRVAVRSARFKLYYNAQEDAADTTTAFTYDSVLGPYIMPLSGQADWDYKRNSGFQWTDYTADLDLLANGCPEIP